MKLTIFLLLFIIAEKAVCQGEMVNQCPQKITFQTSTMGVEYALIPLSLDFEIRTDSIFVSAPIYNKRLLEFVVHSSTCQMQNALGTLIYKVSLIDEGKSVDDADIKIEKFEDNGKVSLTYVGNPETRVFTWGKKN